MTATPDLGDELDSLCRTMLSDATKEGVKLDERLKVFKIVAQHHANMQRLRKKHGSDAPGNGETMTGLRDKWNKDTGQGQPEQPAEDEDDGET